MKKIIAFISGLFLLLFSAISLTGCIVDNDEEIAKKNFETLMRAIQNKDRESLKELFAPNKIAEIKNFDSKIDELLVYYQGEYVSFKGGGPATDVDAHDGRLQKAFRTIYDITTTVEEYRLAFVWYIEDTADVNNIGIWKLIFLKKADDLNKPYWGGDAIVPEIHIGKFPE